MFRRISALQPYVRFSHASSAAAAAVAPMTTLESTVALKPSQVVVKLNDYIVGQADAKRAVAIALRNRWRRHMLSEEFKSEVSPTYTYERKPQSQPLLYTRNLQIKPPKPTPHIKH